MVDNSYHSHQDCMASRIGEVVDAMQVLVRSNTCRQYDLNSGKFRKNVFQKVKYNFTPSNLHNQKITLFG